MSTDKEQPQTKYGFYSQQAAKKIGVVEYATPDGGKVQVTAVGYDPAGSFYHWGDKVCVGEVTNYIRTVSESDLTRRMREASNELLRDLASEAELRRMTRELFGYTPKKKEDEND